MISQQRIDELLFSEPNMVKIIRQVEIEATAELRAERDTLRALLAGARGALPQGWSVRTNCDNEQRWIVLTGPRGQSAAFSVPLDGVRAEVLRELQRDFDAALRDGK
jgi:hypothetical protein